jgi:multiple antibiotic resistance protein
MDSLNLIGTAILALFAILNPVGVLPAFLQITRDLDSKTRGKLFNLTVATGFITLLVLTFTGRWIMQFVFQITIDEFRIAGGILLTIIAVQNTVLLNRSEEDHKPDNILELGVVPMAIPLLVGPGSIVTSILILDRDGPLVAIVSLVVIFLICWVIFRGATIINRLLGRFGSMVVSRIMYIFIAAIGVDFLLTGIAHVFKIPLFL